MTQAIPITLQMTEKQEFGLLFWLMQNPIRRLLGPFPTILFMNRTHFKEPRAQWLAREIIIQQGDFASIKQDSERTRQRWLPGFEKWAKENPDLIVPPPELAEKLRTDFPHPEFNLE